MPLTPKGEEIKKKMASEYGAKKGESVFYASANKGTIKNVHESKACMETMENIKKILKMRK